MRTVGTSAQIGHMVVVESRTWGDRRLFRRHPILRRVIGSEHSIVSDGTIIGERLKRLRGERGLTQEELAERAGVSSVLVSKLEQGARQSARLTSLTRLAQALDVPLSLLLDRRPRLDRTPDATSLLAVRNALLSPSSLPGIDAAGDGGDVIPLAELEAVVGAAWEHYWAGRLGQLAAMLPTASWSII